jgi:hypothetical protein
MLDKVYSIEWLNDITIEEREFARRIMAKMNSDLKYPAPHELPFTLGAIMNNIIFFKRIADGLDKKA